VPIDGNGLRIGTDDVERRKGNLIAGTPLPRAVSFLACFGLKSREEKEEEKKEIVKGGPSESSRLFKQKHAINVRAETEQTPTFLVFGSSYCHPVSTPITARTHTSGAQ